MLIKRFCDRCDTCIADMVVPEVKRRQDRIRFKRFGDRCGTCIADIVAAEAKLLQATMLKPSAFKAKKLRFSRSGPP